MGAGVQGRTKASDRTAKQVPMPAWLHSSRGRLPALSISAAETIDATTCQHAIELASAAAYMPWQRKHQNEQPMMLFIMLTT